MIVKKTFSDKYETVTTVYDSYLQDDVKIFEDGGIRMVLAEKKEEADETLLLKIIVSERDGYFEPSENAKPFDNLKDLKKGETIRLVKKDRYKNKSFIYHRYTINDVDCKIYFSNWKEKWDEIYNQ